MGTLVNDRHSQLNPTLVNRIVSPDSREAIQVTIDKARCAGKAMCITMFAQI